MRSYGIPFGDRLKTGEESLTCFVGAAIGRPNREVPHRLLRAADGRPYESSEQINHS